jgi:hypothetical protein
MIGTGPRARALAEVLPEHIALAAVVSPHVGSAFGAVPRYRDVREAIDEQRPEAVIIAAATDAHVELATLAIEAGLPVLLEKPVARTVAQARAIGPGWVSCAHQEVFASGLSSIGGGQLRIVRRGPLPAWGRAGLLEALHHAVAIAVHARGPRGVVAVDHEGESRPERISVDLDGVQIRLEHAPADEQIIAADDFFWRRRGPSIELGGRPIERAGSDDTRMLAAFQQAVITKEDPPIPLSQGIAVLELCHLILDALERGGAPLTRPHGPKHVASARYRMDGSHR